MLTVPASFIKAIAGFIAAPLPRPGLPTKTVYRFGYRRHLTLSTQVCLFRVAEIAVAAHQKWYFVGLSVAGWMSAMYSEIQSPLRLRAIVFVSLL
jgi:hypothetical protein